MKGKRAALEVRLGAMAGAGPGPGDLRGDLLGGGERERKGGWREDQGGTNRKALCQGEEPLGWPSVQVCLPAVQGFHAGDQMVGHPGSSPG